METNTNGVNGANRAPRRAARDVARDRLARLVSDFEVLCERLLGLEVDDDLQTIASALASMDTKLSALPDDFRPGRKARTRAPRTRASLDRTIGQSVPAVPVVGLAYRLASDAGNAAIVLEVLDAAHVRVVFLSGSEGVIATRDLGAVLEG